MTAPTFPAREAVTIRLAIPQNAKDVRLLRLEALAHDPTAFAADYDTTATETDEQWAERIAEYARDQSSAIFIAVAGMDLVGMAGIGRGHWPKTQHYGTVWGVYVREAMRGQYVGEQLEKACLEWGRQNGLVVAKLGVNISNIPAIRCYTRCGFTVYGVEPKSLFYEGVYYDELLMALSL